VLLAHHHFKDLMPNNCGAVGLGVLIADGRGLVFVMPVLTKLYSAYSIGVTNTGVDGRGHIVYGEKGIGAGKTPYFKQFRQTSALNKSQSTKVMAIMIISHIVSRDSSIIKLIGEYPEHHKCNKSSTGCSAKEQYSSSHNRDVGLVWLSIQDSHIYWLYGNAPELKANND
jgi:hypothetical protein